MGRFAILKSKHYYKNMYSEDINEDYAELIYEVRFYEDDKRGENKYILLDIDSKDIIMEYNSITEINLSDIDITCLVLSGIYPNEILQLDLPETLDILDIEFIDYMDILMSKDDKSKDIWRKLHNISNSLNEKKYNDLEKLYRVDFSQIDLDEDTDELIIILSCLNVKFIHLSHILLPESILEKLSKNDKLEILWLSYIYNDNIKFSKKLIELRLYGTTIGCLSELDFSESNLEILSLGSNKLEGTLFLEGLPKKLKILDLKNNYISFFEIDKLPKELEELYLESNDISNDLFDGIDINIKHRSLRKLDLSNNKLEINNWLLKRIIKLFPVLECIKLLNNINYIPIEILDSDEDGFSSMEAIKEYLTSLEVVAEDKYIDLCSKFNLYNKKNFVEIEWYFDGLPTTSIIYTLQSTLSKYVKGLNSFKIFKEGLFFDIYYKNISIQINSITNKSVTLGFYTKSSTVLENYFYKYTEEVNSIISNFIHHKIVPEFKYSDNCESYKDFYDELFYRKPVKGKLYNFRLYNKRLELLVYFLKEEGELKFEYIDKDEIAFIVIRGHYIYPIILRDNRLENSNSDINKFQINLQTNKEIYIKAIENFGFKLANFPQKGNDGSYNVVYINTNVLKIDKNGFLDRNIDISGVKYLDSVIVKGSNKVSRNFKLGFDTKTSQFYTEIS